MFNTYGYEDEKWCKISVCPNYLISDLGRVYNSKLDHFMKTRISNNGYERVGLFIDGHQKEFLVHRLVAKAFLVQRVDAIQVNHIDGDKLYNVVENLEWVTVSENHKHAFQIGLKVAPNKRAIRIIETGEIFESIRACSKFINGIPQGVHNCLSGSSHTYFGFTFEYV